MSALDSEDNVYICLAEPTNPAQECLVVQRDNIPPSSLWAAVFEDPSQSYVVVPDKLPLPEGEVVIPHAIKKTVLNYLKVSDGKSLPILEGESTTGIYVKLYDGTVRRRAITGCNLSRYLPPNYVEIVQGLNLEETMILKYLAVYLGLRDLEDIATLAFVMIYNCLNKEEQNEALQVAQRYTP